VLGVLLLTTVLRRDFSGGKAIPWHSFGAQELAEEVGLAPAALATRMHMQFEVDHRLLMKLYLWEGKDKELPHHYQIDPETPALTLPPPPGSGGPPSAAWCEIAVAAEATLPTNGPPRVLIRANEPFNETFHIGDRVLVKGIVVDRLPDLFKDGKLAVYRRQAGETDWRRVDGELRQPSAESKSDFPVWYQLTLDANGALRAHLGRVPYWRTTDAQEWKGNTERVLERELGLVVAPPPPARDPFNGAH
jgi:hypothetical protein